MKKKTKWKKWLLAAVAVVGIAALLLATVAYLWYRRAVSTSLPQTSGTITVAGLEHPLQIHRDRFGVPHIIAAGESDLYFGMGYAMAQDRLWQMDFMRRLGSGRLAEILGPELLPADRFFRTISAGTNLQPPGDPFSFALKAFTRGINAYLRSLQSLPLEFRLLGYHPQPWSEGNHIAILRVMNWSLSLGWKVDLTAARMLEKVGEEKLKEAFPAYPAGTPLTITKHSRLPESAIEPVAKQIRIVSALVHSWGTAASNNWVISSERSASGKPILANDTHLELTNPGAWWEVHLICPTLQAAGFAIPGLPGLAVGRNRHTAWGITTVMADDVDFYIERIDPTNRQRYWDQDRWQPMQSVKETIRVKGQQPVSLDIRLTRRGPLFSDLDSTAADQTLSVRWTGREVAQTVAAIHRIAQAQTTTDIVAALRQWHMPGQNFVFADTGGNIGYWCCATIPIRKQPFGLLPVPGWQDDFAWDGWIPFEQRPHRLNPEKGFVATANNRLVGPEYPYHIGRYWEPQDRIARIHQLLDTEQKLSAEDFKRMQTDITCLLAAELTPLLIAVFDGDGWSEDDRRAGVLLENWDFQMKADSPAACLFEVTYHKLLRAIFEDELGPELFEDYMRTVVFPPRALRRMLRAGRSAWTDDRRSPQLESLADIIRKSLREALDQLRGEFGEDPFAWRWGRKHTLTFDHVLGRKKPLDRLFNIGSFPVGGNHLTVSMSLYRYANPFAAYHGASQRMIVDLANPQTAWHVLPTGQSGLLGSAHNDDQIELYLSGRYRESRLRRAEVERHTKDKLVLLPADASGD